MIQMDALNRPDVLWPIIIVLVGLLFLFGGTLIIALGLHLWRKWFPNDLPGEQPKIPENNGGRQ